MSLSDFIQITRFGFCQPNQELQFAAINQTVVIFPVQCLIEMVQLEIILRTLETVKGNTKILPPTNRPSFCSSWSCRILVGTVTSTFS